MKVWVYAKTDRVGSKVETTFEVDDDCSDSEIEEFAREVLFEQLIEWNWRKSGVEAASSGEKEGETPDRPLPTIEEMVGLVDFGATPAELLADPAEEKERRS